MLTILLMTLAWYLTKLFYTQDPLIRMPELEEHGLITVQCAKCAQYLVISNEHMRTPFYCVVCK